MTKPIVWFCVNLKSGGMVVAPPQGSALRRHELTSFDWLQRFPDLLDLSPLGRPDVIFMQEAEYFDRHGDELLLFVERQLHLCNSDAYRGFLTRAHRSVHHQAIFVNTAQLHPVHHWHGADPDEPHGLCGFVEVIVDGDELRKVWLKSVHLDARDGDCRLAEAKQIHAAVPVGQRALIAGAFSSTTSHRSASDGEPRRGFSKMSERRYFKAQSATSTPDGTTDADTRAVDYLIDSGWTCQHIADGNTTTATTLLGRKPRGELITARCLTSRWLDKVPGSAWIDTSLSPYSDDRAFGGAVTIGNGGVPR